MNQEERLKLREEYEKRKQEQFERDNPYVYCSCCGAKFLRGEKDTPEMHDTSCIWR